MAKSRYRDGFLIGFSHPKASYFLLCRLGNCSCVALPLSIDHPLVVASLQSKRKYPKTNLPGADLDAKHTECECLDGTSQKAARLPLMSCAPRIGRGGGGIKGFLPFMPYG